jgi:nicotinamidase-related amidase
MSATSWITSSILSFAIGAMLALSMAPPPEPVAQPERPLPQLPKVHGGLGIKIKTSSKSYFARQENGAFIAELRDGKRYYQVGEGEYSFHRTLRAARTAVIVMDPWEDSGSHFLNSYFEPVIREKLMPLIAKSLELKIPVIVLTNAAAAEGTGYGSGVHREIKRLAEAGKLHILYHQDTDSRRFAAWLRQMSIDTLIYAGLASNVCVIGRDLGMINMQMHGFRLFFVPEASAAVEFADSWKTGSMHKATTSLISQWVGELIGMDDYMQARLARVY